MKKSFIVIILIVIFLEVFVFNFSSLKSMFYEEKKININEIKTTGMKMSSASDDYYIYEEESYFTFEVNKKIKNIYLDIGIVFNNHIDVILDYTDDSSNDFYDNNMGEKKENIKEPYSKTIVKDIEKSKYINCYHLGNTHQIKVKIDDKVNKYLSINEIIINKRVPIFINYFRMFLIFTAMFVIYNYTNNSFFKTWFNKNYKYILTFTLFMFSLLIIFLYKNTSYVNIDYDYYTTIYKDAIKSGSLELPIESSLSKLLDKLDNPYDYTERSKYIKDVFDTSYYNGKFYMYFGILPALLMTITHLSMNTITCIFSIISAVFMSLFLNLLFNRYVPKISNALKLLMIVYFLFNSRLLLLIPFTRYYEMLIVCGYALCSVGLYLFLRFYNNDNNKYLFFASLFLSLSLMCRVNMIIVSIFAFYLIYKKINKKNIFILILPYIVVGIILMYLNYIRFGNIFDFGINYQLGIVDNSYLKFNLLTTLNGIICYLFRMPLFSTLFPYVGNSTSMFPYYGFYFNNSTGNGIIVMSLLGLVIPFIKRNLDKETKKMFILSIVCGLLLLLINNTAGGLIKRYTLEFTWLFLIPIIIYSIICFKHNKKVLLVLVIISCIMNFLVIFDTKNDDLRLQMNNNLYYELMYF